MGQPLLTFEDEFIHSMCGISDEDVVDRWVTAFEEGLEAIETAVREKLRATPETRAIANEFHVEYDGDAFVVVVPEQYADAVMDLELGTPTSRPRGVLRSGVARGCSPAAKAISEALEMP